MGMKTPKHFLWAVDGGTCLGWARVEGPIRGLAFEGGELRVGLVARTLGLAPP